MRRREAGREGLGAIIRELGWAGCSVKCDRSWDGCLVVQVVFGGRLQSEVENDDVRSALRRIYPTSCLIIARAPDLLNCQISQGNVIISRSCCGCSVLHSSIVYPSHSSMPTTHCHCQPPFQQPRERRAYPAHIHLLFIPTIIHTPFATAHQDPSHHGFQ